MGFTDSDSDDAHTIQQDQIPVEATPDEADLRRQAKLARIDKFLEPDERRIFRDHVALIQSQIDLGGPIYVPRSAVGDSVQTKERAKLKHYGLNLPVLEKRDNILNHALNYTLGVEGMKDRVAVIVEDHPDQRENLRNLLIDSFEVPEDHIVMFDNARFTTAEALNKMKETGCDISNSIIFTDVFMDSPDIEISGLSPSWGIVTAIRRETGAKVNGQNGNETHTTGENRGNTEA